MHDRFVCDESSHITPFCSNFGCVLKKAAAYYYIFYPLHIIHSPAKCDGGCTWSIADFLLEHSCRIPTLYTITTWTNSLQEFHIVALYPFLKTCNKHFSICTYQYFVVSGQMIKISLYLNFKNTTIFVGHPPLNKLI